MKNTLSQNIIRLAESCPYPLYLVGGRVRDFLAGISAQKPDNDICAPADAEDFVERAKAAGFTVDAVYKNTGTVKLRCGDEDYVRMSISAVNTDLTKPFLPTILRSMQSGVILSATPYTSIYLRGNSSTRLAELWTLSPKYALRLLLPGRCSGKTG